MMIKANGEYLDFNESIEIERSIKLLDDVSTINGDFSYSFNIQNTSENRRILGVESIHDITRPWTQKIPATLFTDTGVDLQSGFISIEDITDVIQCSFFSGNSDWFALMDYPISSFSLKTFDKNKTSNNIVSSWSLKSGIVFPLVDNGTLLTRNSPVYYEDDFIPYIYVKDVINGLLSESGIKLKGTLLNDALYNSTITTNNSLQNIKDRIESQTVYIGKNTNQSLTSGATAVVQFNNLTGQYYNSTSQNWESGQYRYVFSENCKKFQVVYNVKIAHAGASQRAIRINTKLFYNGSTELDTQTVTNFDINPEIFTISFTINSDDLNQVTLPGGVAAGDYIDLRVEYDSLVGVNTATLLLGSDFMITPTKFYKVNAKSLLPKKNANEFIADIFKLFNVFCSYNAKSSTLTANIFDSVIRSEAIDISDYIMVESVNFTDFVQDYGKLSKLNYSQQDFDEVDLYNQKNDFDYGCGAMVIDNDFIQDEVDLVEPDFISAFHYDHNFLGSLPKIDYVEMVETDNTRAVTTVTDNGDGYARITWSSGGSMAATIVRISDSTVEAYNGDYDVISNLSTYVLLTDLLYQGDATATITELDWRDLDNDEQSVLIHMPSSNLVDFAGISQIEGPDGNDYTQVGFAYFAYPDITNVFSSRKFQSLSFGDITGCSQPSLKTTYYSEIERIINNGVMVRLTAYFPESLVLDFLSPVMIKTNEINGLFLLNRISGYQGSHLPCDVELIKI